MNDATATFWDRKKLRATRRYMIMIWSFNIMRFYSRSCWLASSTKASNCADRLVSRFGSVWWYKYPNLLALINVTLCITM